MKALIYVTSALALSTALCGCATVTRGTTTKYTITSAPPGAAVRTSTGFSCASTPCTLKLPRKEPFDATVTKTGYKPQTVHVRSQVQGGGTAGFVGNVVAGGVLGMVVDGSSGAMNDLIPNPLNVNLEPEDAGAPPAATPTTP